MTIEEDYALENVLSTILQEVIERACSKRTGKVATALRFLLVRAANSRLSIQTLCHALPDGKWHHLDIAALLRCMFDAYIQAEYILIDPKERTKRATLYLEFEHIERFQAERRILKHHNFLSRRLAGSPHRAKGEAKNKKEYDRVEPLFRVKKGNGVRTHWYPGNLKELAVATKRENEYDTFVSPYNSCVHSGVYAVKNGPHADDKGIRILASTLVARLLLLNIKASRFKMTKDQMDILKEMSIGILEHAEQP